MLGACPELKLLAEARTLRKPQGLRPIVSPVQSIVPVAIAGICETGIVSVNNSLLHQRIQSSDSKKFWTCFLKRSLSYVLNNVMASRNGLPPNMRSYNTWRPLKELQDTSQARWNSLAGPVRSYCRWPSIGSTPTPAAPSLTQSLNRSSSSPSSACPAAPS